MNDSRKLTVVEVTAGLSGDFRQLGGRVAAPIAKAVMQTLLAEGK